MKKPSENVIIFDETMQDLFIDMEEILKKYGLKYINSVVVLKALLEEKESLLYDFLCATSVTQNPFKQIIKDCEAEFKNIKKKNSEKETTEIKRFTIKRSDEERDIEVFVDGEVYELLVKTITNLIQTEIQQNDQEETDGGQEEKEDELNQKEIIVTSENLFAEMIEDMPRSALSILKNNGVYLEAIREYYYFVVEIYATDTVEADEGEDDTEKIPKTISDFVTILSAKYKGVEE